MGGDLGGYYSTFWKSPEIMANDNTYLLQGRSYYVSPAAYRVNQQISINGEDFLNFGIMWLTKEMAIPPSGQFGSGDVGLRNVTESAGGGASAGVAIGGSVGGIG